MNSLTRKKPNQAVQKAAQNMAWSKSATEGSEGQEDEAIEWGSSEIVHDGYRAGRALPVEWKLKGRYSPSQFAKLNGAQVALYGAVGH